MNKSYSRSSTLGEWFMPDKKRKRKHGDTRVSLAPLSFEQAIATIAQAPRREDSQAEGSGRTI